MTGMMLAANNSSSKLYVDDVFSTYLYTGNGSTQTINNGIDLAGKGGLVWEKTRGVTDSHHLFDTVRGNNKELATDSSAAQYTEVDRGSFLSNGYVSPELWGNGISIASWTFRNADRFFTHTVISHTNGTPTNIALSSLGTVGQVIAKITNTTGDWITWHRSLTAGNNIRLNTTAAQTTTNAWLSVSGTTATLSASAPTGTYVVYGFAHDPSADGIIQCGSFTTDGSGNATVNLGWEPQFLITKSSADSSNGWWIQDTMRGMTANASLGNTQLLQANLANAEEGGTGPYISTTGFNAYNLGTSRSFIYLAIRRPNKPPTTGTEVYNAIARTGTGAAATVSGVGFALDLGIIRQRTSTTSNGFSTWDRLRGANAAIRTNMTNAEWTSYTDAVTGFDTMDGVKLGTDASANWVNANTYTYINHFFRRAPGFMDEVCDVGTGSAHAINHNLTVAPEFVIRKSRSAATQWEVWHSALAASEKLVLNSNAAKVTDATAWNGTLPGASSFTVGTGANVNASGATFVTYLFATLPGISKVGGYTGNGTSQTINCGFSGGARFVLCKATSTTGSWWTFDTVRGIVSGNDPALQLNSTAAEVASADALDPYSAGFTVNQEATCSLNANGVSYVYLAIG